MLLVLRIVVGLLVIAHGLVRLLYLAAETPEFSFDRSWLPRAARRPVGLALVASTVLGFAFLGLAVRGVPGLAPAWPQIAAAASLVSALLIVLFWTTRLIIGVAIDVALLLAAVTRPEWADALIGTEG